MLYKLLIVEDSDIVVGKLRKLLEPLENLDIIGRAEDEENAINMIKENKPDFVILDISLKEGTGINVLNAVKDFKNKPYIVILSNLSYGSYKDKCMQLGAQHFFDKAMEFEKVYDTLEKITGVSGENKYDNKP
jgi:DNA-binding NarL/FixJ family response regulator